MITPDPVQVERWKEYENALAKSVLPHLLPEEVLCEWDILGRTAQNVFVWAVCRDEMGGGSIPAVIHLEEDGTILNIETTESNWSEENLNRLFPADVQARFVLYPSGRAREMAEHIEWRRSHLEEPPLIVLSAASAPQPTQTTWLPYNPNGSDTGCHEFVATVPVTQAEGVSQEETIKQLFEVYLDHYKASEMGERCRLEDYKIENVLLDKRIAFLANEQNLNYVGSVQYSVQIKEVPSWWVAGNGELANDGWIVNKGLIVGVIKVGDEYVLKILGTGP